MALSIAQKLKIKEGSILLTINAPADFKKSLGPLPEGVKVQRTGDKFTQLHWFVHSEAQVKKELSSVLKLLNEDVICWIYFPKRTSGVQTDLTRDKGWDSLMSKPGLQWITLVAFDDTWSAFAIRRQVEVTTKKNTPTSQDRPIAAYVDAKTKTVRLPDDLASVLAKHKKAAAFFESLSFTNRKEYVEWIVTAKREETRNDRVQGTLERLQKEWKNPRNI